MSFSSSGSFSFRTTAAVVCLENTETHPCVTLDRRTTAATCSVTSTNSRAAVVRKASVSAQIVRPPMRRTRAPAWSSEPSSKRRAGLAALPTNRCCACKVTRAVTDGHRRYIELRPALPPRRPDLVEAVAAVDGAAHGGREGDLGGLAALGADDFVELLGATGAPNVAVDRPAVGTAGRLVLESLRGVELLLTDGEDEVETTVTARQSLVAEAHGESPLFCLWISEVSPERSVALDPAFPGAIIASAKAFLAIAKRLALSIRRYSAAVARALFLVEDELLFAQRLRAAAGRLGGPVQAVSPSEARARRLRPRPGSPQAAHTETRPAAQADRSSNKARPRPDRDRGQRPPGDRAASTAQGRRCHPRCALGDGSGAGPRAGRQCPGGSGAASPDVTSPP